MNNVFDEEIKKVLENAQKLMLIGETKLSKQMCIKCVEKVAKYKYNGEDLLALFYGKQIYGVIEDAADAARYIFIAKCAINVYNLMARVNPALSSTAPWAISDIDNSDPQLLQVFNWLRVRDRKVEVSDCQYFKLLVNALEKKDPPHFKMHERIQRLTLLEIIRGLTSNSITITNNGELRWFAL